MNLKDQKAIYRQREETEKKNNMGTIALIVLPLLVLTIVYIVTRKGVHEMEAREVASRMSCKYISNHVSNGQKVLVADCSGAVIHKAYE